MEYTSKKLTPVKISELTVHRPILSEEDYQRRYNAFLEECDKLMRHYFDLEEKRKRSLKADSNAAAATVK